MSEGKEATTTAEAESKFKYYEDDDDTLDKKRATRFDRFVDTLCCCCILNIL